MPLSMNLCLKSTVWDIGCQFLLEVRGVKGGGEGVREEVLIFSRSFIINNEKTDIFNVFNVEGIFLNFIIDK